MYGIKIPACIKLLCSGVLSVSRRVKTGEILIPDFKRGLMMKKGLIVLCMIFCLMFILNLMTPLLSDDYFNAFVWPEGSGMHSVLPATARKISGISDIFDSLKAYYYAWGGRVFGQFLIDFFVWRGKEFFNIVNALMAVLLIAEIYWISHEGKITTDFNCNYVLWIFFSLWSFNIGFVDTFLWLSGSCDYLWSMVMLLAFLLPYIRNYYDTNSLSKNKLKYSVCLFLLGLFSGCSRETLVCLIIVLLAYWLILCKKRNNLQSWKIYGFLGLCIGYSILLFAPGNFARLSLQQSSNINVFMDQDIFSYKLTELFTIVFFHFFLWYYIIVFFLKFKRILRSEITSHITIAKLCVFIASVSGVLLFLTPTRGIRLSFLNLVFLIIAAASLFRAQERNGISILNEIGQTIFKLLGSVYLSVTIVVSLWGNFIDWVYWDEVLAMINSEQGNPLKTLLQIEPPLTERNGMWLYGSGFFHIVGLPVDTDEQGSVNRSFSRYYNIKGIKVVYSK